MQERAVFRVAPVLTLAIVALYATVQLAGAFEHHDLACELKTPQHCVACVSSAVGPDPASNVVTGSWHLADAGCAILLDVRAESLLIDLDRGGRSPPACRLSFLFPNS